MPTINGTARTYQRHPIGHQKSLFFGTCSRDKFEPKDKVDKSKRQCHTCGKPFVKWDRSILKHRDKLVNARKCPTCFRPWEE